MSQITAIHSGVQRIMRALQSSRNMSIPAMPCRCGRVLGLRSLLLFGTATRRDVSKIIHMWPVAKFMCVNPLSKSSNLRIRISYVVVCGRARIVKRLTKSLSLNRISLLSVMTTMMMKSRLSVVSGRGPTQDTCQERSGVSKWLLGDWE